MTTSESAATWDDEVIQVADRMIYGPCPACNNWQLDVPFYPDPLIFPAEIEAIIRQHDAEDHPGALDAIVEANRA